MTTLRAAIQMYDGMTPALKAMRNTMGILIDSFETLQAQTSENFDTAKIAAMRNSIVEMNEAFDSTDNFIAQAKNEQEKLNRKIHESQNPMDGLMGKVKGLLAVYGGFNAVKGIAELSDSMSQAKSRLDMMNDGLQTTEELQNMIFQSAQRSRGAYLQTADAVSKMGLMASDAFSSNAELVAFAETINKQFIISGTSVEGVNAAMLQLTQAMGSGVLRGEELNSIFEQAPLIIQTIADYLDVPIGQIRKLAEEGELTSDVVKNAMLSSAGDIDKRFQEMPYTFAQACQGISDDLLMTFQPAIEFIAQGAGWIHDNWDDIEPIFWGVTAAVGAFAIALGFQTAATWLAVDANKAMIASMLSNPLLLFAVAIGAIVALLYKWIQAVGGVEIATAIAMNGIQTAWDWTYISLINGVYWVMNKFNLFQLGMAQVSTGVQNIMSDMKVGTLMILQNMINGAIDIINGFISTVDKIPGVSIEAIEKVTFGTSAELENKAEAAARNAELASYTADIEYKIKGREDALNKLKQDAMNATAERQAEIALKKTQAAEKNQNINLFDQNTISTALDTLGDTAENTAKMADTMSYSTEELKYLRDIAEREAINRFTTAEIRMEVHNENNINSEMDIDGFISKMTDKLKEEVAVASEGV